MRQVLAWVGFLMLATGGCARDAYERAMAASQAHLQHQYELNAFLEGRWSDPKFGISLRPPKPNQQLSRAEARPFDARIAAAFGPQLLAAFRGQRSEAAGSIAMYVVGAREGAAADNVSGVGDGKGGPAPDPASSEQLDLKTRVRDMIKEVFRDYWNGPVEVPIPIENGGMRRWEMYQALAVMPAAKGSAPAAGAAAKASQVPTQDTEVAWKFYFLSEKSADVVVAVMFPKSEEQSFAKKIELSLETLTLTAPAPASASPTAQPSQEGGGLLEQPGKRSAEERG